MIDYYGPTNNEILVYKNPSMHQISKIAKCIMGILMGYDFLLFSNILWMLLMETVSFIHLYCI
jgi:hypothetical protein